MSKHPPSLMLGLLGAALATVPLVGHSAVIVTPASSNRHVVINPGDTIIHDGPGPAIFLSGESNTVTGSNISITTGTTDPGNKVGGVRVRGGTVSLQDSSVTTHGGDAIGLQADPLHDSANINVTRVRVETFGAGALGAVASGAGARIDLTDSSILTHDYLASGLLVVGKGAVISASGSSISTEARGTSGAEVVSDGRLDLANTRISVHGADARGISSYAVQAGSRNSITLTRGSRVETQDGVALLAAGGDHVFSLDGAEINARSAGVLDGGVLLRSQSTGQASDLRVPSGSVANADIATGRIQLNAAASRLSGDVLIESGSADITLGRGSVLTGALIERGGGRVNRLALDASSVWNVRADSSMAVLDNAGTVAFVAPGAKGGFKTLTVNQYIDGGLLVLNTRLGDDASPTDRLVIDGGSATGRASLRILNAGGSGAQTTQGIRVVQTIHGGTTAPDAFRLDAGSTGFRQGAGTLAVNGYEYSLVRGGQGGAAPDWYLTSAPYTPAPPAPAQRQEMTPQLAVQPQAPASRPAAAPWRNVSPESGAYIGNQLASAAFFTHGLHDRVPSCGACGEARDASAEGGASYRGIWTRVQGRQDSGLRMAEGRVGIERSSQIVQLGGDLLTAPLGGKGAVHLGLMGGYGSARSTSTSSLALPGGTMAQARARGKVSGYSAGVYGTYYQDDASRMGAYADGWLQYGRFNNRIDSELGAARYDSTVWSASAETGYALQPFAERSPLGPLVVEPHVQLVYSHYDAQDAVLQGTRMGEGNPGAWDAHAGVRMYPAAIAGAPAVRPFMELDWLHRFNTPSVRMGPNTLAAASSRDRLELTLGAEGRISHRLLVAGHVFGYEGRGGQHGYGGMVDAGYRW